MESVGIKELKNRLSAYLRAAASGETVLVTDRGQVVAEIIAPRVRETATPQERLLGELARRHLLAPARVAPGSRLPRRRPLAPLAEVLRELDADRNDR